jgi:mono/diheme cytochrome c family protein
MPRAFAGSIQQLMRATALSSFIALIACSGGEKSPAHAGASGAATAAAPSPRRVPAIPVAGAPPAGATIQMVARGDSIFHGRAAGGLCYVCHGTDANGTPLGPTLLEHQWLTGSGSYEFIQQRVTDGMAAPTPPYLSPMPPMGGVNLSREEIKAVSAYVYAISHTAR